MHRLRGAATTGGAAVGSRIIGRGGRVQAETASRPCSRQAHFEREFLALWGSVRVSEEFAVGNVDALPTQPPAGEGTPVMGKRTRLLAGAVVLAAVAVVAAVTVVVVWRPAVRTADTGPDDTGTALPAGTVLFGPGPPPFEGTVGPWVPLDGGKRIAFGNGRRIRVMDAATRAELRSLGGGPTERVGPGGVGRRSVPRFGRLHTFHSGLGPASGVLVSRYNPHRSHPLGSLSVSPDGRTSRRRVGAGKEYYRS
jgi:hypothetical protein